MTDFVKQQDDFSLVLGGPTFQFFRRTHLEGDHGELLRRRVIIITLLVWLPLLLLSVFTLPNGGARLSFLEDLEVHARFLVALPILIAGELLVHLRIRPVIRRFVERRIVRPQELPRFDKAIASAVRMRNSIPFELGLLLVVYTLGMWIWNSRVGLNTSTWYANAGGRWNLTPAGYWYVFVSIPIVQFILLRWYFRLLIWFRFLWQVSRMDLHLIPTHPDRCAVFHSWGKARTRSVRSSLLRRHARGCGRQSSLVRRRKSVVLQVTDWRIRRFLCLRHSGPAFDVPPKWQRKEERGWTFATILDAAQGLID